MSYPAGFAVNASYDYQALGPGKDIRGVSFTIPAALTTGTNLADDTYLSVERLPGASPCTAVPFLSDPGNVKNITENGVRYSVATSSDAGAGNFYDETVYADRDSAPCIAIRYFVHSHNIGAYDPGTVRAFDQPALIRKFDEIRRTFKLAPGK